MIGIRFRSIERNAAPRGLVAFSSTAATVVASIVAVTAAIAVPPTAQVVQPSPAEAQVTLAKVSPLPAVRWAGRPAKIHTQGLLVDQHAFLVTGRLDSSSPRRSLLLRFARAASGSVGPADVVDITPDDAPELNGQVLDHPGGFDQTAGGEIWVPLSTSHRRGPSIIRCYRLPEHGQPLDRLKTIRQFRVNDHIGAVCCQADGSLLGANWDTLQIYRWDTQGRLLSKTPRARLIKNTPGWQLAVQDWKHSKLAGREVTLAGGLDRSPNRAKDQPVALVQWLDVQQGKILRQARVPHTKNLSRPPTNEGLAWFGEALYLLPEDIGRGAKVLQYRLAP